MSEYHTLKLIPFMKVCILQNELVVSRVLFVKYVPHDEQVLRFMPEIGCYELFSNNRIRRNRSDCHWLFSSIGAIFIN